MNKKRTKTGISTGASAAAAAKAAMLLLYEQKVVPEIIIKNLQEQEIKVPIKECQAIYLGAKATVIKDGGDDPDITNGLDIIVEIQKSDVGINVIGGTGVGVVTKPGLQVPIGEAAINPVPRQMITNAIAEVLPPGEGVIAIISVPAGEKAARRTLNPRLGIIGGISILGTTGIVEPMSEERFKVSLVPQIKMARAYGYDQIILTPGRIGERTAIEKYGLPQNAVAQMSNFVGYMLHACVEEGIKKVILWGHHSKLVKVAAGSFHTHSKVADGRLETIAAYAGINGATPEVMQTILQGNTAEGVLEILKENNLLSIFAQLAQQASKRAMEHVHQDLTVGTVLLDMQGNILGMDDNARQIGGELGWQI